MTAANVSFTPLNSGEAVVEISWLRNPNYFGKLPRAARLVVPAGLTSSIIRQRLVAGTLDVAYGPTGLLPADFQALVGTPGITALVSPPLQTRFLLLNTNGTVTSSLAVRRAINFALNKVSIAGALSGLEQPADRLFAIDTPYCSGDIGPLPAFSVAAANAVLDADSWAYASPGFPYRSKQGVALRAELLYVGTDASATAIMPFIVNQMAAVGIEAATVPLDKAAYQARMFAGDFSMGVTETLGDPYDPTSYVSSWRVPRSYEFPALAGMGPASNISKAALDNLITAALSEFDAAKAQQTWTSILTAINLDAAFAPLTYMTTRAVARQGIQGLSFGAQQFDMPLFDLGEASASSSAPATAGVLSTAIAASIVGIFTLARATAV
jgi:nickel transport system substrate-binding protein